MFFHDGGRCSCWPCAAVPIFPALPREPQIFSHASYEGKGAWGRSDVCEKCGKMSSQPCVEFSFGVPTHLPMLLALACSSSPHTVIERPFWIHCIVDLANPVLAAHSQEHGHTRRIPALRSGMRACTLFLSQIGLSQNGYNMFVMFVCLL